MASGSVIVDMGSSQLGGNVAGSVPGQSVVTPNGVTIIGAENLAASVPTAASNAFSRNISALLLQLVSAGAPDASASDASASDASASDAGASVAGALKIDTTDDIQARLVVAYGGEMVL